MHILLVQTGFFGDLVLSTPVIDCLVEVFPGALLSVLTTPQSAVLLSGDRRLSSVIPFDKRAADSGLRGILRFARKLRSKRFDAAFSLHKSYRTALLLRLAGIPLTFGFQEAALSFLYTATAARGRLPHEVHRNLALLSAAGIGLEPRRRPLRLVLDEGVRARAAELLDGRTEKLIGLAPGSVWATKRWKANGYAEVARTLSERGYEPVLIGGSGDTSMACQIEKQAGIKLRNLVGRADLLTSAALIERLSTLITNDSAPLHIAAAVQTPCVAIFCATVPEFGYGPWEVPHRIIEVSGLDCRPCARHGGRRCPLGTHACSELIDVHEVVRAALELAQHEHCREIQK